MTSRVTEAQIQEQYESRHKCQSILICNDNKKVKTNMFIYVMRIKNYSIFLHYSFGDFLLNLLIFVCVCLLTFNALTSVQWIHGNTVQVKEQRNTRNDNWQQNVSIIMMFLYNILRKPIYQTYVTPFT